MANHLLRYTLAAALFFIQTFCGDVTTPTPTLALGKLFIKKKSMAEHPNSKFEPSQNPKHLGEIDNVDDLFSDADDITSQQDSTIHNDLFMGDGDFFANCDFEGIEGVSDNETFFDTFDPTPFEKLLQTGGRDHDGVLNTTTTPSNINTEESSDTELISSSMEIDASDHSTSIEVDTGANTSNNQ
ncbi:hypothetical protein NEDG_00490 [Nematocida displodere]|uniref:Uncharacterized protein n=1 Tax=Nematocida displodere TaxID=1805483 RepID=A0A177EJ83_9MICR|nr:hypothetical protein NEDG_00490 [Nematocida displodere]